MLATYRRLPSSDRTVDSVLAPIHDRWLKEVRRFIEPAASAGAGFWDRWTTVRYLADQFRDHFRLERALLASLEGALQPEDTERLTTQADELERLLSELDTAGRRRGTAATVAVEARRLMEALAVWCAELELATTGVPRDILSINATHLLDHLKVSGAVDAP